MKMRKLRCRSFVLLGGLSALSVACAPRALVHKRVAKKPAELTDPLEILKRVDAAARAVKAVRYHASFMGTGMAASRTPSIEGTVVLAGWLDGGAEKFRCRAKVQGPGSDKAHEITVGGNGKTYFVVDHQTKTAYEDMDPAVLGRTGAPAQALMTLEFVHPTPFSDEINGDVQELRGSKRIGGEDCYEIRVVYAGGRGEAIWHFSKKDFLPRGRLDLFPTPNGERAGRQRFITKLEVDPPLDEDTFQLDLPPGFTKSDDFAP